MGHTLLRRASAEFLGTLLSDNLAVTLLINALATVAALGVLIWILGPISGAHFNPVVSGVEMARREMPISEGIVYVVSQIVGACLGAMLANVMFSLPPVETSSTVRDGAGVWIGEIVATAGLLLVIGALTRTGRGTLGPILVPAWIGAAYFFTASTSFANPAVTIGRSLTDTFAGIAPVSVAPFIAFQIIGAVVGALLTAWFYPRTAPEPLDLPAPVHDGPR